ncbi:MAG: hypothetical protein Q8J71_10120 [Brevundimonas sp.]|nr:hypothetical protein [Brevundimonas sp.]
MKSLLLAAAALLIAPVAAQAQVAAGTVPNTFDAPPPAAARPAAPAIPAPANARSEEVLREIIAGAQAGTIDYGLMTDDLAGKMREQEAAIRPLIESFGPVQAVDFVGARDGADLFAVIFANAATEWVIGFNDEDKVAALLFRPAE